MSTPTKVPLSAVMMAATHFLTQAIERQNMLPRDLARIIPGTGGKTYAQDLAHDAAKTAWMLAECVENTIPEPSKTEQG